MLFSYHLLYFCTALSLIIMLSSHYHHHKSKTFSQLTQCPFTGTLLLFSVSFGISFEHAVQLPFTVFLYSPFPDNYAFLSLSPSQIKNIQSADTVPVHGHSPLVYPFLLSASEFLSNLLFSYHLLYFCTALFLIIILSSNHLDKSKTLSQLTQCPFTGTLLLFRFLCYAYKKS